MTVIVERDEAAAQALTQALGSDVPILTAVADLAAHLREHASEGCVVIGPRVAQRDAFETASSLRLSDPATGVVLVRRRIETSLLAEALRSGVREVVEERDLSGLAEAVSRQQELSHAIRAKESGDGADEERGGGTIVTVFSAKGGCGKTTIATNLAAALADRGNREVCLVDLDLHFGDVAIVLQLFPSHTIADAVPLADSLDQSALRSLLTPHSPGLTTLIAPVDPSQADSIPGPLVGRILEMLRQHFAYIVVDTPPAFDDQVLAALDVSDLVALIATLDIPSLKNLKLTLETLDLLNFPKEKQRVVLNRADSKVGLSLAEVEKTLRAPISAQVPSSRDVPASINRGTPLLLEDAKHPVSLAIKSFAAEHVIQSGHTPSADDIPQELRQDRRGLLRRRSRT